MPQAPLTVRIKDAYKDGVVFYKDATSIPFLALVNVYGEDGQLLQLYQSIGQNDYTTLTFTIVSGAPGGYIAQDGSIITSANASVGTFNAIVKVSYVYNEYIPGTNGGADWSIATRTTSIAYFPLKIIVENTPTFGPNISASGDLDQLTTVFGTASQSTSFTVEGEYLTSPITVTAPNGFQISKNSSNKFSTSVIIDSSGTVSETSVFLRLSPSAAPGTYSGNISLTSTGATSKTLAVLSSTIDKLPQAIGAFAGISNKAVGDSPFAVTAPTANSGLAVTLSVKSGPATISGNTVTLTGVGTVVLAANQAGNTNYDAATEVITSFAVSKATQTIGLFSSISNKATNDAPFAVTAPTVNSGLTVTLSVKSGPATISGNTVTLTGIGTVVLAANQAGNTDYEAAAEVTTSFLVTAVAAPSAVIRNGDLLMDVGVAQNIKVTFNSVYQTIYTRVTGLPAGMRYVGSPDGFLSGFIGGTPLSNGTYNVTIETSYKTSETSETINTTKTVVYTVNEAGDPAILLSNQNLTVGTSVNIKLRASDVSAILAWSATGLPAGLVCGTGTSAAITGAPTTAGTFNSTITLSCRKINSTETTTVTKPVTFTVT